MQIEASVKLQPLLCTSEHLYIMFQSLSACHLADYYPLAEPEDEERIEPHTRDMKCVCKPAPRERPACRGARRFGHLSRHREPLLGLLPRLGLLLGLLRGRLPRVRSSAYEEPPLPHLPPAVAPGPAEPAQALTAHMINYATFPNTCCWIKFKHKL